MRLTKEIKIDDKTYTCYEVRPKDLMEIFSKSKESESDDLKNIMINDLLPKLCTASFEEIENMYPSEIEQLVKGVEECNRPFLDRIKSIAKLPEMRQVISDLKNSTLKEFSGIYANLRLQESKTLN